MYSVNKHRLRGRLPGRHWIAAFGFVLTLLAGPAALAPQAVSAADSCSPATTYGSVTMHVSVPATNTYTVWTRMKTPSSSANSVLLNVVGTCYNVGASTSIPANTWVWIDYYDGNSANVITHSLNQGTQTVTLTGTAANVSVDQLEFVVGSCVPSGDGSNCKTSSTTTGGGSGSTGGTTTTGGGTRGSTSGGGTVVQSGGTLMPTDTSAPVTTTGPLTLQPDTSGSDSIIEVQYYLNNKLLATVTTPPFSYKLNTKNILNGTYTLKTKTTYASGNSTTTSQKLIIKNPASFTQFMLEAKHYIVFEVIGLIVLFIGFRLLRRWLRSRRPPMDSVPPFGGGGDYAPLSYGNPPTLPGALAPGGPSVMPLPQPPVAPPGNLPGGNQPPLGY